MDAWLQFICPKRPNNTNTATESIFVLHNKVPKAVSVCGLYGEGLYKDNCCVKRGLSETLNSKAYTFIC